MGYRRKKKNKFFLYVLLPAMGGVVFYGLEKSLKEQRAKETSSPASILTLQERLQKKDMELEVKKRIQQEELRAEQFEKLPDNIDPLEPESSDLDRGLHLPENRSMKKVFEDLKQDPYKNDMYEDPEHIARRQMEHQMWLEEHLKEKNEKQREEFIKKFVQIAKEQGYQVHFTEDMQVLLQAIEPDEEEEDKPEEIKIIYE